MNNADRRRIANCFDRLLRMTYPASGVEVRPASLRSAILNERKLAMDIMGCDCGLVSEPREGGTVEVKLEAGKQGCVECLEQALHGATRPCPKHRPPIDDDTA